MQTKSLFALADHVLLRDLAALLTKERALLADVLLHLAEVDRRKLYVPAGYASMNAWCIGELHMSENSAWKRTQAARAARDFPVLFAAVAAGRLHLSAVCLVAPHLNEQNADDLVAAATHRTKAQLELMLATRFPKQDVPTVLEPVPAPRDPESPSPGKGNLHVGPTSPAAEPDPSAPSVPEQPQHANHPSPGKGNCGAAVAPAKLAPLSPERFALQLTLSKQTHDKLRYAQELLGHAVAHGDIAEVLDRALDALIAKLEQKKFAARARSKPLPGRGAPKGRYVPAAVRRDVWKRDGGQCSFVSEKGHRCEARRGLELDHLTPFALGGEATVEGIRLRCRAHNQYEAERAFGQDFMRGKREQAGRRAADARARGPRAGVEHTAAPPPPQT